MHSVCSAVSHSVGKAHLHMLETGGTQTRDGYEEHETPCRKCKIFQRAQTNRSPSQQSLGRLKVAMHCGLVHVKANVFHREEYCIISTLSSSVFTSRQNQFERSNFYFALHSETQHSYLFISFSFYKSCSSKTFQDKFRLQRFMLHVKVFLKLRTFWFDVNEAFSRSVISDWSGSVLCTNKSQRNIKPALC